MPTSLFCNTLVSYPFAGVASSAARQGWMMRHFLLVLIAVLTMGMAAPDRYAPGQVWEYRARPGDVGSLLKIQRVETHPVLETPIYHVSVIGVRFAGEQTTTELPHLPVSGQTLDASVTRLSERKVAFPTGDEGIAIWRADRGGVYTISVADIVAIIDRQLTAMGR